MQTIIYIMDKQRASTVYHRQLISIPVTNENEKEYKKEYICITESLSCTEEIKHSIVNQLYLNKI